jgi:hypothetical protein
MVKASNLIKKLLPIGLVIGGLLLLSQSKRVNIFRTTQPSLTIKQADAIPILFEKTNLVPIFQQAQLTPQSAKTLLEQEYGTLYRTERVRADTQIQLGADRYKWLQDFKDVFKPL